MTGHQSRMTPMERMRAGGVTPDRALGQNFLIDPNILDLIERTALLGPEDTVLEVGPGLGVLTERLVARCGRVHCVELDPDLAAMVREEFGAAPGFNLVEGDALELDLASLRPPPDKFVANLPYNVAVPLVMKSLANLPSIRYWCLMVQKEIADRLFAGPGTRSYGGASVMAQLFALKTSVRPISGNVFYPRPRVRSALLAFRRRGDADTGSFYPVREVVRAAFSHRRKTLANSMAEGGGGLPAAFVALDAAGRKQAVARELEAMGLPGNARPQQLEPERYLELARALGIGRGR